MHNIIAHVETTARDCDGMHYRDADYEMEESEKNDSFGDLEFFHRVMSYVASPHSEDGTLKIRQENGMPVFEWSERTEEGFSASTVTFEKGE